MTTAARTIPLAEARPERRIGVAERNFWIGIAITLTLIAVFQIVYWIEREVYHLTGSQRFVPDASETAMRYFTIPHIIIGFLFSVTAMRNRSAQRRALIGVLLLVGAGLCTLYWYFDGYREPLAGFLVYTYFLVHEMRDESYFYTLLGDSPPIADKARFTRMTWGLMAVTLAGVGVLIWPAVVFGLATKAAAFQPNLAAPAARAAAAAAPLMLWAAATYLFLKHYAADFGGRIGALLRAHAPLFRLFAGVVMILGLAMLLSRRPYAIILMHVSVWYVFTLYMLRHRQRPQSASPAPSQRPSLWTWMRTTPAGFRVLHLGMAFGLMAIGVVWMYGLGGGGWLWYFLAPESFLYWTIMHITVSFVPR